MALTACRECGTQVSTSAAACPQCGAKPTKPTSRFTLLVGGVFALIVAKCVSDQASAPPAQPPRERTAAEQQLDAELTKAVAAGNALKKAMKDPDSFKIVDASMHPGGVGCYNYRAKNSFNATTPGSAVFVPPATMLTQERDGNKFVKTWNDRCAKSEGRPLAALLFD